MLQSRADVEAHIKANPVTGSPREMRAAFAKLSVAQQPENNTVLGGVGCGVFGDGPPVIWLHGGGYVFGTSHTHAAVAARFAEISQRQVIVPDYRRAPEHTWPAALDDALAVCADIGGNAPIIGDSAGGHLALNVTLSNAVRPAAIILLSPNTDRTGLSTTRKANSDSDLMNDDATDRALADLVFPDTPDDDPRVSPLLADLAGLPPVYLTASRAEVLFGDACLLHSKLRKQHVPVQFDIVDDLFHMWMLWPDATVQARRTLKQMAGFLSANDGEHAERKQP